jgi:hypothetical protein
MLFSAKQTPTLLCAISFKFHYAFFTRSGGWDPQVGNQVDRVDVE